jgi:uncharacterized hydrophobic protein (TIGR00271 family)
VTDPSSHEPNALRRLRDMTGEVRRHHRRGSADYSHILRDDGHLDRDEQMRIMQLLLPAQNRAAVVRFGLMLTLSVTIAVMGLAADSAAVVIGAMLIAPLMTPIMTFSAAVGLGLGRRAVQAAFMVVIGSIWSIVFAIVLARLLPSVTIGTELLARTRPDVRDLIVAVAAGAAGAYATAREDVSSALPGVAVAVALVPPLAATGVLIEADRLVLAEGSALLFLTNLLAIIVSALAVLLATGVIPTLRLCLQSPRIAFATLAIVAATAIVSVPLTTRSLDAATSSKQQSEVTATVESWLGDLLLDVDNITIEGQRVTVELTGLDEPPQAYALANQLVPVLGEDAEAVVRWDQRAQGEARAGVEPAADPVEVARAVFDGWLTGLAGDGVVLELVDLEVTGSDVLATVSGPSAPPPDPDLSDEVADAIGVDVVLQLRYIPSFDPGLNGEPAADKLDRYVRAWIGDRASVRSIATTIDGSLVLIDLGADGTPAGLDTLRKIALDAVDGAERVEVRVVPFTLLDVEPDEFVTPPLG